VAGGRVAVWGLTFKAHTDDLRDSPAVAVTRRLVEAGARVAAYDPTRPPADHPAVAGLGLEMSSDAYAAATGAVAAVVLTEWEEFAALDFAKVAEVMEAPSVIDTRNILDPAAVKAAGCRYRGMGRR
jgi:UDPglucose 6-dehydrogenase